MASYGYMAKIGADTSGLQTALKQINSSLKATDNELNNVKRAITKAEQAGTDSAELLKQKEEVLNNAINETSQKLERLKSIEEQVRSAASSGNISAENYRDYQREVANTEAQLRQYQNQLLQTQQTEQESAGANQMVVTSLQDVQAAYQRVAADIKEFTDAVGNAAQKAVSFSKDAVQYSINVGKSFESSMSQVRAYSGAVGEDFTALENAAKEAGATTSKSATEAADALGYMALAGWDTQQMLDGLMPIVKASEAGTADLKRTSDLVTDSMSAMGVATSDLAHYLDICTAAQSNSNTTMTALLEAYVGCGGTLRNLNVPLEESATLLGTLANRGIKASEAGTSLNSILVNLMGANKSAREAMESLGVSAWDAQGNFIGVTNTLKLLDSALEGCTEQQKAFLEAKIGGKTQMDTLQALIAGVREEYNDLYTTLENSNGALMQTADTMHDNLAGALTSMNSALEALGNEFYDYLEEPAREAVDAVTDALRKLTSSVDKGELSAHLKELSDKLGDLMEKLVKFASEKGIDLLIDGLEKLIDALSWCADHFEQLVIAAEGLGAAFVGIKISKLVIDISVLVGVIQTLSAVAGEATVASKALSVAMSAIPAVAVGLAISALAIGIGEYIVSVNQAEARTAELRNEMDRAGTSLTDTVVAINKMRESMEDAEAEAENSIDIADRALDSLDDLVDENGNLKDAQANVDEQLKILNETFGLNLEVVDGQIQGYKDLKDSYEEYCKSLRKNAQLEAMHPTYVRSIERLGQIDDEIKDLETKAFGETGTGGTFGDLEAVRRLDMMPDDLYADKRKAYTETDFYKYWKAEEDKKRGLFKADITKSGADYKNFLKALLEEQNKEIDEAKAEKKRLEDNRNEYEKLAYGSDDKDEATYYDVGHSVADEQSRIGKEQSDKLIEGDSKRKDEILKRLSDLKHDHDTHQIPDEEYYEQLGNIINSSSYLFLDEDTDKSDFWKIYDKDWQSYLNSQNKKKSSSGKKSKKEKDPEQEAERARQKKESEASKAISDKKYELNYRKSTDYDYSDEQFYDDLEAFAETLDKDTDAYDKLIKEIEEGRYKLAEGAVNAVVAEYKNGDIGSLEELREKIGNKVSEWGKMNIDISKYADEQLSEIETEDNQKAAKKQRQEDEKAAEDELDAAADLYENLLISEEEYQQRKADIRRKYAEKNIDTAEMEAEKEADIAKKRAENEEKLLREYTSGKLYSDVTEKGGKERKVFDDLSKRTEEIKKYAADYAKLSQMKDVPPDLLAEIRTMDFDERRAVVAELMAMNETNRSLYFSDYTAYHEAAKNAAEIETGVKFDADGFYVDSAAEAEKHGEADGNAYMLGFMRAAQNYSPEVDLTAMQSKHSFADLTGGHDPHGGFGTYISVNTPLRIEVAGVPVIETTVGKMLTDRGLIGRNNNNF